MPPASPLPIALPRVVGSDGAPVGNKCGACRHWFAEFGGEVSPGVIFAPCFRMPPVAVMQPVPVLDPVTQRPIVERGQPKMGMTFGPQRPYLPATETACGEFSPRPDAVRK